MNNSDQKAAIKLPEGIERLTASVDGYEVLVRYQGWRVAVITYAAHFDVRNLCRLERHMMTDEVFVLLNGQATLYIGNEGTKVEMEPQAVYNVKCGEWHSISVSSDALVLICENIETGIANSEYMDWSPLA